MAGLLVAVGFVGMGQMGEPMAVNIHKFLAKEGPQHGFEGVLRVWNRSADKCKPVVDAGAAQCSSLQEMAASCGVVHMCMANDAAVQAVVGGLLQAGLQQGTIVVDHSTVLPETTEALAQAVQQQGGQYVAAPVWGRPDAATAARLVVAPAGPEAAVSRVQPLLAALSRKTIRVGERQAAANAFKLSGNFCIVSMIEMLSQGMTLAEKNGVGRATFMEFINDFFASGPISGYGQRMADDKLDAGAGFTVELGLKDVGHMRRIAERSDTPLPLADMAFQHLLQARAHGHGNSDWGAIALGVRQSAGLPMPPPPPASSS